MAAWLSTNIQMVSVSGFLPVAVHFLAKFIAWSMPYSSVS